MADSWWYFGCRGNWLEMERWSRAALAATPDEPSVERAAALRAYGTARVWAGDGAEGFEVIERSLEMSRTLGDTDGVAWALFMLALWARISAHAEQAMTYAAQGLEHARAHGIEILEADAKQVIAWGDPSLDADARLTMYEECASIYHRVGDFDNEASAHRGIGDMARGRRDWDEAQQRYEASLELSITAGCLGCAAISEIGLANLARGRGDLDSATDLCRGPLRFFGRMRQVLMLGAALGTAARITNDRGDPESAARLLGSCHALVRETSFWGFAEGMFDRAIGSVRPRMDDDAFHNAFAAGRAMSGDDAVAFALEMLDRV
jgi:ATP/maltotriose-dependent transcriptional regulator MalT